MKKISIIFIALIVQSVSSGQILKIFKDQDTQRYQDTQEYKDILEKLEKNKAEKKDIENTILLLEKKIELLDITKIKKDDLLLPIDHIISNIKFYKKIFEQAQKNIETLNDFKKVSAADEQVVRDYYVHTTSILKPEDLGFDSIRKLETDKVKLDAMGKLAYYHKLMKYKFLKQKIRNYKIKLIENNYRMWRLEGKKVALYDEQKRVDVVETKKVDLVETKKEIFTDYYWKVKNLLIRFKEMVTGGRKILSI